MWHRGEGETWETYIADFVHVEDGYVPLVAARAKVAHVYEYRAMSDEEELSQW